MRTNRIRTALVVVSATLVTTLASPAASTAGALEPSPLSCTFESVITISPAIGAEPVWYDWTTAGEPASITCHGWLRGVPIAGSGEFIEDGRGYGSRVSGRGAVDFEGWLPGVDGSSIDIGGHLWLERTALNGTMSGLINGAFVVGTYGVEPRDPLGTSTSSSTVTVRGVTEIGDERLSPPPPGDVEAERDRGGVRLSWASRSSDDRAATVGFHIYVDGAWIADVDAATHEYRFSKAGADDATYAVSAFSAAGVESETVERELQRRFEIRAGAE